MGDLIQLLPDSIANQIAAGEVIQRPASVVKELMENAIDAKASTIHLLIKDAGKTLIRVTDNGKGMSATDARMAPVRHATSKIKTADDLFDLHTMGFRGEALASVVSIAQVEIRTKQEEAEIGVQLEIEGSEVISQEPITCKKGTSISVKNLFYNVPARRKFLKRDTVEMRHIIDEFERVALANPEVMFTLSHNDNELFHLPASNFRQRVVGVFGKRYNEKLVPLSEETDLVKIEGFLGKPEMAKKSRGEQFFFVNNRFIKSSYLHHAIKDAMSDMLQAEAQPSYFLHLQVNPSTIDVNIHPTKTEIKFEDERAIYAILKSATRQALGKHHVSPSLDFETETGFSIPLGDKMPAEPTITVNPAYNPFDEQPGSTPKKQHAKAPVSTPRERHNLENWQKLYQANPELANAIKDSSRFSFHQEEGAEDSPSALPNKHAATAGKAFQIHGKYIVAHIKSGLVMIHQARAHERVLYESFIRAMASKEVYSQQQLFPQTVNLPGGDAEIIHEIQPDLQAAGVDIRNFGANTYIIQGLPTYVTNVDPQTFLESILEDYKNNLSELKLNKQESLARSLSKKSGIKTGRTLSEEEMLNLIDELFACENPYSTPTGKRIINTFTLDTLDKQFN
jgi:DNA mismatch repair protein MutL